MKRIRAATKAVVSHTSLSLAVPLPAPSFRQVQTHWPNEADDGDVSTTYIILPLFHNKEIT